MLFTLIRIVAQIHQQAIGDLNLTASVFVIVPVKENRSVAQQMFSFPYVLVLLAGVAAAAVAVSVLVLRRTRKKTGFDLDSYRR
jgi:hypothetical protein